MNPVIIAKYRKVDWYFATYKGIELQAVYSLKAADLEVFFVRWEQKWRLDQKDINNPKIPLSFVQRMGTKVYETKVRITPVIPAKPPFDVETAED